MMSEYIIYNVICNAIIHGVYVYVYYGRDEESDNETTYSNYENNKSYDFFDDSKPSTRRNSMMKLNEEQALSDI